jgi:hypothetical protein
MTTAFQRPLSRTIFAAGLAVIGTIGSFAATTAPAQAGGTYRATLSAPVDAPRQEVLGTALWKCDGDACRSGSDDSSPVNACTRVAREFGAVASFATSKGELTPEQLEKCNARA